MVDISYDTGEIYLFDEINKDTSMMVCKYISDLNAKGGLDNIIIKLHTSGGCALSAFAIISAMRNSEIPIDTMGCGEISSAGFLIFVAGRNKIIMDNSFYMWHEVLYGMYGSLSEQKNYMNNTLDVLGRINLLITANTKLTEEELVKIYENRLDKWYTDDEMFELLCIDGVEGTSLDVPKRKTFYEKLLFWRK